MAGNSNAALPSGLESDLAGNAKHAREAIRHFALRWQLKAESILSGLEQNQISAEDTETQKQFVDLLISRANSLYDITQADHLWTNH